jgi:Fe2+ transport system protein FeoA
VEQNSASSPGGAPPGCLHPDMCPLSQVREGASVRIKRFNASEDVIHRLRELGMLEEQRIQLLAHNATVICRVCNVRMGLSPELAEKILVEPVGSNDKIAKRKKTT